MRSAITKYNLHRWLNNTCKNLSFLLMVSFCLLTLLFTHNVNAQGVAAGTNISNIALVNYQINNTEQSTIESSPTGNSSAGLGKGVSTDFLVDRKVDLLVTGNTNANVTPGDYQAEVTFTLQNQGNAIQEFDLIVDNLLTSDDFDSNNCNIEVTGVSGTPVSGVVLPTSGNIKLSPDQLASISVQCDIPLDNVGSPILAGETALIGLIAEVVKNEDGTDTTVTTGSDTASNIETVFADDAGEDDAMGDGMHSARRTYISSSATADPTLIMNKTIESVVDPSSGNTAVTGSEVTYKIQVNTAGVGNIENLVITDPTPMNMTYKLGSIRLNNVNQTDLSDSDNTDYGITNADTATINLGSFAAGSQYEILLTYIIN
ncbi:hypothetical protein [uncultured Cocleimonas sp.]|uniref:hypothetical protein n=1 Tax=uncultured Cocleimonas sp. TaxID=1051587 RepID=UPI00261C21C7|nr:hypothetical protein [uncultured Cocleimonas sp.]